MADALPRYQAHLRGAASATRHAALSRRASRGSRGCAREGFPLAVVTNKATRFVRPHLERGGHRAITSTCVIGGDDAADEEARPGAAAARRARGSASPPARLLMVGDSGNDVEAARAAGCPVLVVPYGYNEGVPVHDLDGRWYSRLARGRSPIASAAPRPITRP